MGFFHFGTYSGDDATKYSQKLFKWSLSKNDLPFKMKYYVFLKEDSFKGVLTNGIVKNNKYYLIQRSVFWSLAELWNLGLKWLEIAFWELHSLPFTETWQFGFISLSWLEYVLHLNIQ